jgi:2,4-didehydro-3-deoxy-L-rhamnonate hydrolase
LKLVSIGDPGHERPGVVHGDQVVNLGAIRPSWPGSWRGILEAGWLPEVPSAVAEALRASLEGPRSGGTAGEAVPNRESLLYPLDSIRLGPPIPDPSKIVAVGLNYRDHALEQKKEPPAVPLLFAKAPSSLIGPRDPILLPDPAVEDQVDAEGELCVVIGRRTRNVSASEAGDAVLGFTIMNDVSGRRAQYSDKQWFRGKSFDCFAPCGPWIVTGDELGSPSNLAVEVDWDSAPMQRGNTRDLIFGVNALIAYASRTMTLLPGDLIATGTPAGVGVFRDPPVFLRSGQIVTVRVQGVGELVNPVA